MENSQENPDKFVKIGEKNYGSVSVSGYQNQTLPNNTNLNLDSSKELTDHYSTRLWCHLNNYLQVKCART